MNSPSLKAIGQLPHFPGLLECYQSDKGFIVSERFGGKKQTEVLHKDYIAREDDVYILPFPKSGTTWLQEIVYLICSDLDYETAKTTKLGERSPFLEFECSSFVGRDVANKLKSPRVLKCHYPYSMLPESIIEKKCKLIYSVRNPKDTVVSYYFFSKANAYVDFDSDFSTFFDLFLEDKVLYGPYWKHVTEYWNHRNEENVLIVTYEDMKKDLVAVIKQISSFLGKSYSDEQLRELASHCSFSEMKANPTVNPNATPNHPILRQDISDFMRKGQVGDWKNYLSEEMSERMDDYVEKHLGDVGLKFVYEQE